MKATYYLCPVEGFVSQSDEHCFIYDCESEIDKVKISVTNLCFLTDKPYTFDVTFDKDNTILTLAKGIKLGYDIVDITIKNVFDELRLLNSNLIESLLYIKSQIECYESTLKGC